MQNNFTADKAVRLSGKQLIIQKVPILNPTFMFKCGLNNADDLMPPSFPKSKPF